MIVNTTLLKNNNVRFSIHYYTSIRGRLKIKMSSCQYRDPHVKDRTVLRPSYLWHGNTHTWERRSLYWDGPQGFTEVRSCAIKSVCAPKLMYSRPLTQVHTLFSVVKCKGDVAVTHWSCISRLVCIEQTVCYLSPSEHDVVLRIHHCCACSFLYASGQIWP